MTAEEIVAGLKPIPFDRHDLVGYIKKVDAELARIKPLLEDLGWNVGTDINVSFHEDWTSLWPPDDTDDSGYNKGLIIWGKVYEALDLQPEIIVACVMMIRTMDLGTMDPYKEIAGDLTFFTLNYDT